MSLAKIIGILGRKEEETFHLSKSIARADASIPTNGSLEVLHREIKRRLAPFL